MDAGTKAQRHEGTKGAEGTILLLSTCLRAFVPLCLIVIGCTDNHKPPTSQPLTMEQKQQQLLDDPFGYKTDTSKVDISGGDIGHFDKDAFKKDVDHVLSP